MMGRKIQQQNQFPGRHPGCMWGILHVLKYQRWRYIKKRLPHRRPSATPDHDTDRHSPAIEGADEDDHGWKGMGETQIKPPSNESLIGDEKATTKSNSSTKNSVRSRLKSLISDELYRKKGSRQHRRSYTCPVPPQQQQQPHHHHATFESQSQVEEAEKPLLPLQSSVVEKNTPPPTSAVSEVHSAKSENKLEEEEDDDGFRSKEISNALDMAIVNKEFLSTILQDSRSHFVPQFTTRKTKYSKSMSFPSTSLNPSSLKEPPHKQQGTGQSNEADKIAPKQLETSPLLRESTRSYSRSRSMSTITAEHRANGMSQLKQSMAALINTSSSLIKGRGGNKTTMRCLKDLKQKIRHVITMEAVLHKIPRGDGRPSVSSKKEDVKENVGMMSPRKSYEGDSCKFLLASRSETQRLKRTSSLCESLDKYCQLYESIINKGVKTRREDDQLDEVLDDLVGDQVVIPTGGVESEVEAMDDDDENVVVVMEKEKKDVEEQITTPIFEFLVEESNKGLSDDDGDDEKKGDASISQEEAIISPPTLSTFKESEQILRNLIANKLNFLEDQRAKSIIDEIIVAEEEIDEKKELQSNNNQQDYEVVELEVDPKEKTKFEYVKGILDISGFSRKELLGTWHSNDQPLDPAMFEEARGADNCYHHHHHHQMAMFDLINEVLMEIYAKSHTYCPKPLSWLSHIRPMPVGSHVLKEVWGNVKWSLSLVLDENEHLLDYLVGRDLGKSDGWMNLQFDCECVGLELEDWIFDDLLDELAFEDHPTGFVFPI